MKRFFSLLLALGLVLAGCAPDKPSAGERGDAVFIALRRDSSTPIVESLEALCDDAALLSGGSLRVGLQFVDSPLDSGADFIFLDAAALEPGSEAFRALNLGFLFSSPEQARRVLNAGDVLDAMTGELHALGHDYSVHSAFYCGQTFLLTGDHALAQEMRSDSDETQAAIAGGLLGDGSLDILPADLTHPPAEGAVYTAGTDMLYTVPSGLPEAYILLDTTWRVRTGLLLVRDGRRGELAGRKWAAFAEAAAMAMPACSAAYEEREQQIFGATPQLSTPSGRLRRAARSLRSQQPAGTNPVTDSPLYRLIADYTL